MEKMLSRIGHYTFLLYNFHVTIFDFSEHVIFPLTLCMDLSIASSVEVTKKMELYFAVVLLMDQKRR